MRSVFKFVSYWNPSIRVDEQGKASVEFKLPDNLTGWRVLAMAVSAGDRMGLGESTFKVNQLTEIRPVLPNQVLDGDSFSAGFSVMNRTGESRNIEVKITAEGQVAPVKSGEGQSGAASTVQTITAEPYKRYTVRLPVEAAGKGEIVFTVQAGDDQDRDGLRHTLKVLPRLNRNVAAAYGTILTGEASQAIEFPENMRPDSGLLSVGLAPSILGGLEGPFDFMKVYSYRVLGAEDKPGGHGRCGCEPCALFFEFLLMAKRPGGSGQDTCNSLRVSGPQRRNGLLPAPR